MKEMTSYRGSRKHVLDWTSQPTFIVDLLQLAEPVPVRVSSRSRWMPRGYGAAEEARLETFGPGAIPTTGTWKSLQAWWLRHERGANTPNWDIALSCEIEGRPGLILVEAKANCPELTAGGKLERDDASANSRDNRQQISLAIQEAREALRRLDPGVAIDITTHYQLSNRVSFAWKLASLGIPTVLMYLGFVADSGIADVGQPFASSEHWRSEFVKHADAVVPSSLFEKRLDCGAAAAWFLVRDRGILEPSPAREISTTRSAEGAPEDA